MCMRYFPDYPMPPADTLRHFRERKVHIAASLSTIFFLTTVHPAVFTGAAFDPFRKLESLTARSIPGALGHGMEIREFIHYVCVYI